MNINPCSEITQTTAHDGELKKIEYNDLQL